MEACYSATNLGQKFESAEDDVLSSRQIDRKTINALQGVMHSSHKKIQTTTIVTFIAVTVTRHFHFEMFTI